MKKCFFFFVGFALIAMVCLSFGCKQKPKLKQIAEPVTYTSHVASVDGKPCVAFAVPSHWRDTTAENAVPYDDPLNEETIAAFSEPITGMSLYITRIKMNYADAKEGREYIAEGNYSTITEEFESDFKLPNTKNFQVEIRNDENPPSLYATQESDVRGMKAFFIQRLFFGMEDAFIITLTRSEYISPRVTDNIMKSVYFVQK